jgi:hypothetical protein
MDHARIQALVRLEISIRMMENELRKTPRLSLAELRESRRLITFWGELRGRRLAELLGEPKPRHPDYAGSSVALDSMKESGGWAEVFAEFDAVMAAGAPGVAPEGPVAEAGGEPRWQCRGPLAGLQGVLTGILVAFLQLQPRGFLPRQRGYLS